MNGRWLTLGVVFLLTTVRADATSIASVKLEALFEEADVVAVVAIESADTRAFQQAVYRAAAVQAFKGIRDGETLYFGPHSGYALSGKYVVFLKSAKRTVGDFLTGKAPNPWPDAAGEETWRVLYSGYSVLPIKFTCVFPNSPDAHMGCADAVSVPSRQVILPDEAFLIPNPCSDGSNYDSWVQAKVFVARLAQLAGRPKR